jgi:FkbM family methyltransferase
VLDVGANTGQFAELIRQVLPDARIISFEPIDECFKMLQKNMSTRPPFEAFQLALGNEPGEAIINRNAFSPSSSLLQMKALHVDELPQTREVQEETISVEKLDNLSSSLSLETPFIVKVDVQGFEEQVILGGSKTLAKADAVIIEVSSHPLFEGAPTFDQVYQLMKQLGFIYRGNVDQWKSRKDGRILQFDALFETDQAATMT